MLMPGGMSTMKTTGVLVDMGIYDILPTIVLVAFVIGVVALVIAVIAALLYIRRACRLIEKESGEDGNRIARRGRRL